jgi:plastocyanin
MDARARSRPTERADPTRMEALRMRRHTLAGLMIAGLLTVAACGGGSTASPSSAGSSAAAPSAGGQSGGAGASVDIKNFAFNPATLSVKVGDSVTWTNDDTTAHTVTADDKSFDSGNVAQGATFKHTFDAAGTFSYHCTIHSNMKATITVS